jgi:hypothetical protein
MDADRRLRVYAFHGLRLGCSSGAAIADALSTRLGCFQEVSAGRCDVTFDYRLLGSGALHAADDPPGSMRPVYESGMGQVLYSDSRDQLSITCVRPIRVSCDPLRGETVLSIRGELDGNLWWLSHPLFTLPFIETLKRQSYYSIHAAGVALGETALLFPGTSGSGKSTLAVALVRAGFAYLGDDMLFLSRGPDGLHALAFPEAIDVTDDTVRLLPELEGLIEGPKRPGWPKRQLRVDQHLGARLAWRCRPAALVFPRIGTDRRSTLTPMDEKDALLELLPNILLTEPASSQAHLDALAELAATCQCYRLRTGSDFSDLAVRFRELLATRQ